MPSPDAIVAPRPWLAPGRRAWILLGAADRPLVTVGEKLDPQSLVAERVRDTRVVRVMRRPGDGRGAFRPGATIRPHEVRTWQPRPGEEEEGTVLARSNGRLIAVVARSREEVRAGAHGTVAATLPGGIAIDLAGPALPGVAAAGRAVHGRLRIAVGHGGDELRTAGLQVADAGSILVAGARVDVETLSRARALGISGVIAGGIAGHDLRAFARSEERQRAALHVLPPFAVLILEGFGRRSLVGPPWDLLIAAAGSSVSIFPDPPLLVFEPESDVPAVAPGTIRIAAGPGAGTTGMIDGPPRMHAFEEGTRLLAVPFAGGGRRWIVPLADLERFG